MAEIDLANMDLADMAERINEAIERHITFVSSKSYVAEDGEGDSIELVQGLTDAPVDVGWATLPVGIYAFVANEDGTLRLGCPIYECLTRADIFEEIVSDGLSEDDTLAEILRLIATEWRPQEFELEGRKVDAGLVFIGLAALDAPDSEAQLIREMLDKSPVQEKLPALTAIRPYRHYSPNSKPTHVMTDPDAFEDGGMLLSVGRKMGQTVIEFALRAAESLGGTVSYNIEIDNYDRMIIEAVSTLREAAIRETGEPVVSAYNICEAMGIMHPEPAKQAEIDERMSKLMGVVVRIDYTEQAKQRKMVNPDTGLPLEGYVIEGHAIEAVRAEGIDNKGNRCVRYRLTSDPPTYQHAKAVHQVIDYPQRLLTLAPIREDGTTYRRTNARWQVELKRELLNRVYSMKNAKNRMSNSINYDNLCVAVGVDPSNRGTRGRVVEYTEAFLRALHDEGIIYDFQPHVRRGRSHKRTGADVFVNKP